MAPSILLPLLGYLGIAVFITGDALFQGRVLVVSQGDGYVSFYSSLCFFAQWIKKGIFPFWNPLTLCGHPSGLHAISTFDLYHLFAWFLPIHTAYNTVQFLVVWLKGFFLYLFLKRWNFPWFAAFVGGTLWAFLPSGKDDTGLFFMALSFLVVDRYLDKRNRLNLVWVMIAAVFHLLNVNPHSFVLHFLFITAYAVCREPSSPAPAAGRALRVLIPFLLAGGAVMFHFARLFELLLHSSRLSVSQIQVLSPLHYPLVLFPGLYESFSRPELSFIPARSLQGLFSSLPFLKNVQAFVEPPYVGIFPVYAFGAWFLRPRPPFPRSSDRTPDALASFAATSLGVLLIYLSLHPVLHSLFIRHVPFLSGMHNLNRTFQIYYFCFSLLTAWGMEALLRRSPENDRGLQKMKKWLGGGLTLCVGALFLGRLALFHFRERVAEKIVSGLSASSTLEFQNQRVEDFFSYLQSVASFKNPYLILPIVLIVSLGVLLHLNQRKRIPARLVKILLLLFLIMDLGAWNGFPLKGSTPGELSRYADVAKAIKQDASLYRVMVLDDGSLNPNIQFLRPESNLIFDLAIPDGYQQLYNGRYVPLYHLLTKNTTPGREWNGMLQSFNEFNEDLADLMGVKYFVTSITNATLENRAGYQKIAEVPPYKIFRNTDALPRAFVARNIHWVSSDDEALGYLEQHPENLKQTLVLKARDPLPLKGREGEISDEVEITRYEPNQVQIQANLGGEGYLVLTDNVYPGWKAYLDQKEVPFEIADYTFRAVRMGPGPHILEWVYQPPSLKWGFFISIGSLLLFLLCLRKQPA